MKGKRYRKSTTGVVVPMERTSKKRLRLARHLAAWQEEKPIWDHYRAGLRQGKDKDCGPLALSVVLRIPFDHASQLLREAGRLEGQGTTMTQIEEVTGELQFEPLLDGELPADLPARGFVLMRTKPDLNFHVAAIYKGRVYDLFPKFMIHDYRSIWSMEN